MKGRDTVFHSKVARRIVLLFVSCALLPVMVLAIVSFYEVSRQLREESQKRMAQATRSQGMAIYEHLDVLDSELQLLVEHIADNHQVRTRPTPPAHFKGVAWFGPDGHRNTQWGEPFSLPQLRPMEREHLLAGNSLLKIGGCSSGAENCVLMVRMFPAAGSLKGSIVAAQLDPDYLWATNRLRADLQFCVLSSERAILFCSSGRQSLAVASFPSSPGASGAFEWASNRTLYNAAYWKLMVRPTFLQDPWTIIVSQEHAAVLAPMRRFQNSFPLVILLSLWIVLLFSMIHIRRTLGPLQKLQEGTRQIAARRFESRVEVRSGDEFEGLAASFNSMAGQLGRQFHTLTAINEVDQAIFASLDREGIVDGVLARLPGLFASDCFGVTVFDDSRTSGWTRFRNVVSGLIQTETFSMPSTDWMRLQSHPKAFTIGLQQRIPAYLVPLGRAGMRSFLILPIFVDTGIQAALVCAQRDVEAPTIENVPEARQVADQLAIAFAHAGLIRTLEQQQMGTLTALARAIDAKSEWTAGHSERVTHLAVDIGRNMGLASKDLKLMRMGGLLHDIGKIGTPPTILDKPGKLTADEMRIMQDHVRTGFRILEPIPGFSGALPIVSQHHEWFNGRGYPEGLAGKDISLYARIFAVADCYDALTSDRPYRKGLPPQQVMSMLQEKSGVQFDPNVIEVFTRMMAVSMCEDKTLAAHAGEAE